MTLPVKSILWAPTNSAHYNHLHVEGDPRFTGTPPPNNPGMSDSVWTIWVALAEMFGEPAYFLDSGAGSADWTHMGWYNRRKIAGSTSWSQHSWSNALDIGPYYGVAQQQKFYDFLTNEEDDMPLTDEDIRKVAKASALETANLKIRRSSGETSWIQETADIKSLLLAGGSSDVSDADLDAAVARLIEVLPQKTLAALKAKL